MSRSHLFSRSRTLASLLAITMSATSCQGNSPVSPSGEMESGLPEASGNANGLKLQGSTTIEVIQGKIEMYLPNGDALVRLPDGTLEVLEVTGGRRGAAPIFYGDCPPTLWVVGKCPGGGNAIPSSPSPLVTAKPAPTPSPTSPPASGADLPSAINAPPNAQGKGVFWLNTSSLYLSPSVKPLTIDIVATPDIGHWELSVDGYGRTGISGEGSSLGRPWTGIISGRAKTLPDGKYTLRLTAKGLSRSVDVIIDTSPPSIYDARIESIKAIPGVKEIDYKIAFKSRDGGSGLAPTTAELESVNVGYRLLGKVQSSEEGNFTVNAALQAKEQRTLLYRLSIGDKAGNTASEEFSFSASVDIAEDGIEESESCSVPAELSPSAIARYYREVPFATTDNKDDISPYTIYNGYTLLNTPPRPRLPPGRGGAGEGELAIGVANSFISALSKICQVPVTIGTPKLAFFNVASKRLYPFRIGMRTRNHDVVGSVPNMKIFAQAHIYRLPSSKFNFQRIDSQDYPKFFGAPIWNSKELEFESSHQMETKALFWDGRADNGSIEPSGPHFVHVTYYLESIKTAADEAPDFSAIIPGITQGEYILQTLCVINNRDGKQWPNKSVNNGYAQFGRYMGSAGWPISDGPSSHQWHHLVEREAPGFTSAEINSTKNIYRVPNDIHEKISSYYTGYDLVLTEDQTIRVRDWLKQEPKYRRFDAQYKFGYDAMTRIGKKYGWSPLDQDIK